MITKAIIRRLATLMVALMALGATAQTLPQLPLDSAVVTGTLPNGLTYYIRHNEKPKGQADFYIAQRVGSILEEDNQRGLAHFLEHMCFNGTTHFPGKGLIKWLESIGVKFGANLNATTGVDETIYKITNVPVERVGVQDSCLLILHDWANDLELLPDEIDAERAVIHEEWRTTNVGQMRILTDLLPKIYPGSRYGHRLPIGTMEVVDNFPHQALRDYYERWYRPDQQGIIVVGDIDPARIEAKIKEMFADIEMPADAPVRFYEPVPDHSGTIFAIGHDSEMQFPLAQMTWKQPRMEAALRNSPLKYLNSYVESMIAQMLNERLNDIASRPGSVFAQSYATFGDYFLAKTADGFSLTVLARDPADLASPLAAAYREVLRASRGGFTPSEYERARSRYLASIEQAYNSRDARDNNSFVQDLVRHFVDTIAAPSIEVEYDLVKKIAANVDLNTINQAIAAAVAPPDNRMVMVLMPDLPADSPADYPTEQSLAAALAAVDAENIEALADAAAPEHLIEQLPAPGSITARKAMPEFGAEMLTLSNGATVILKPTDIKKGEILFRAVAKGGTAWLPDSLAPSIIFFDEVIDQAGLGKLSNSDLKKYLAGKHVWLKLGASDYLRTLSGGSTPADLRYLMELIYMTMTDVAFQPDEFEALLSQYDALLHNQISTPQYGFESAVLGNLFHSPKKRPLSPEILTQVSRDELTSIAAGLTANAADFTFIFVGDFQPDSIAPLIDKYIASLPSDPANSTSRQELRINHDLDMVSGTGTDIATMPMQTPQTYAYVVMWADMPYSQRNQQLASIAGQVLSSRLIEIVREREGAVYSIFASGSMDRIGNQNTTIGSQFPMKPEMREKVLGIICDQLKELAAEVDPDELAKAKEYMSKQYTSMRDENSGWMSGLLGVTINGIDTFNGAIESLNSISEADVANFVKAMLDQGNFRAVILDPAE